MSIPTPLLASLQPLQTRHHIQESPSFCKPQGYLLPSQGNPKAQFLATPTTPQGSYSILLHPPQDNYTLSAKPALPAVSPLFNPAVPACALYSPVHVPTRRPAYTCLHLPTPAYTNQPACLPATYKILTHLTYPHLQRWRPGVIKYCRPALPCTVLPVHVPTCLPTPAYTSLPAYTSPAAPVLATKLPTAYTFHFTELRHGKSA